MNRKNLTADTGEEWTPLKEEFFISDKFKRIHTAIKHLGGVTSPSIDYAPMNYPGLQPFELVQYCNAVLGFEKSIFRRDKGLEHTSARHDGVKVVYSSGPSNGLLEYSAKRI